MGKSSTEPVETINENQTDALILALLENESMEDSEGAWESWNKNAIMWF